MTATDGTVALGAPEGVARPLQHIAAGIIGNVLEWYDFAVYGYLAAAIGRRFFPVEDPTASLLAAFAVFAVGFLMRPVGGVLVGHIGDQYGRRVALLVSVCGMAVPTVLIGALPTYDAIGIAAPILLVLLRMVQGMSVGGEYVGSMVFLVESAPTGRRGVFGAFAAAGAVAGILLGSAAAALLAAFVDPADVDAWAWRLPFLAGALIAAAGFVIRRHIVEPGGRGPERARLPVVEAVREHPREIVTIIALSVFNAVGFYISFVYVASWLQTADGIAPATALEINTFNMVILLFVLVGFGWLSDRIGRVRVLAAATAAAFLLAWPLFALMHRGDPMSGFLGQLGFVVLVGAFGVQPATMVEAIGGRVRVSAIAIGYNVSLGLIGGFSPLIATWLIETTGDPLSPAFFVAGAAAVSFVATRFLPETAGLPLKR